MREIAMAAEAELREHGWCQHAFVDDSGRICLSMALNRAGEGIQIPYSRHYREIMMVIQGLFPGRDCHLVIGFNDSPDTTREDVFLVLKHLQEGE
jgi:hypothetical protein